MIRLSVSEIYGGMWKMCGSYDVVFNLLDRDYNKFKTIKENSTSIEESSQNGYSAVDAETHLTQLNFLHSILLAYKQICELYGEICSGRTLLVF